MEESTFIAETIAGVVFLVIGVRLLKLSMRTGEKPERLLGASFLLWGLCYQFFGLPIILADDSLQPSCYFAGRLCLAAAAIPFAVFTQVVFRPKSRLAAGLIAAISACLVAGLASSLWLGNWENLNPLSNPWWWPEWVAQTATLFWMAGEALSQFSKSRQRRRLGLCEPLVSNRYLLWGLASAIWVLVQVVVLAQDITFERTGVWGASFDFQVGALELAAIAMVWTTFFPPAFYRRWINGTAPTANKAES